MYNADIAITGGTIVTIDRNRRIIEGGTLLIKDGRILKLMKSGSANEWKADEVIDAEGSIVMPGLIDVHGHAGHGLVKTLGDSPRGDWLNVAEEIYLRNTTEDFWRTEAQLSGLERLKFGVTSGYSMLGNVPRTDDPLWAEAHAEGIEKIGIRDMLGVGPPLPPWPKTVRCSTEHGLKDMEFTLQASLEVTEHICQDYHNGDYPQRVTIHLSPSRIGDPNHLGEKMLKRQEEAVMRMAEQFNLLINSHAYEGNIEYAYETSDILDQDLLLAHCAGITDEEVKILAMTNTAVAHSPSARAIIRRWCPVTELLDAGVNVAVATDGSGPDRSFCLFEDMRIAARIHRIREEDETLLPPGKLLEMITIDAARAVGMEDELGSLQEDKLADVIIVDRQNPHQYPLDMPIHRLAYVTSGADVSTVIVGGDILMRDHKVRTVDESEVLARAQRQYRLALERSGLASEAEVAEEQLWKTHRP